jgi:hypothetical protein
MWRTRWDETTRRNSRRGDLTRLRRVRARFDGGLSLLEGRSQHRSLSSLSYVCTVSFILWRAAGSRKFPHQHIPACETTRGPPGRVPLSGSRFLLRVNDISGPRMAPEVEKRGRRRRESGGNGEAERRRGGEADATVACSIRLGLSEREHSAYSSVASTPPGVLKWRAGRCAGLTVVCGDQTASKQLPRSTRARA